MSQFYAVALLLCVSIVLASDPEWLKIYDPNTQQYVSFAHLQSRLAAADHVYAGEYHDHKFGHLAELYLLKTFHEMNKNATFALSLEMFERDCQALVSLYVGKHLDEVNFLKLSRPWPNYITDYKPLVDYVRTVGQTVIASNIPRRYASFIAQRKESQLFSMPTVELSYMSKEIVSPRDKYWTKFEATMRGHVPPEKIWDYYRSQCAKDDAMAMSIDEFLGAGSNRKLISFQGAFHSDDYLGFYYKVKSTSPKLLLKIGTYKEMQNPHALGKVADLIFFAPDN